MREFVLAFLCGALIAITVRADVASDRYTIRQHRYSPHGEAGYERFVLQFDGGRRSDPAVRVTNESGSWVVRVANARIDGAIPESAINEKTIAHAHVFRTVAVDTDGSGKGFSLRFTAKRNDAVVKAFWLESPSRLVVDAYASGIPTSSARAVAGQGKKKSPEYFCFTAEAQVGLSTVFQRKFRGDGSPEVEPPTATSGDPIVCYPSAAQVVARVMLERQRGGKTAAVAAPQPENEPEAVAAEMPIYIPAPETKVSADSKRYWIAPYLPGNNTPAVAPMEPPNVVSAEPVFEGLRAEGETKTATAQQQPAASNEPNRRTSSIQPRKTAEDPNDGSFGPMK